MNYLLEHLSLKHLFLFLTVVVIIKTVHLINHHNMITFSPLLSPSTTTKSTKKIKRKSHKKIRRH